MDGFRDLERLGISPFLAGAIGGGGASFQCSTANHRRGESAVGWLSELTKNAALSMTLVQNKDAALSMIMEQMEQRTLLQKDAALSLQGGGAAAPYSWKAIAILERKCLQAGAAAARYLRKKDQRHKDAYSMMVMLPREQTSDLITKGDVKNYVRERLVHVEK